VTWNVNVVRPGESVPGNQTIGDCRFRTLCPGTPLLWDAGYSLTIPDLDFLPAAVVAGRVISKPKQQLCLDLGYKSLASEMAHPRLHFLELETDGVINHSEEHLVLKCKDADQLSVGDMVYALPSHICQLAGNSLHAGIGSDLDGGYGTEQCPYDLDTIADLQKLPDLFRAKGYRPEDIQNIMHLNFVRFLRETL